jgi:hypothetical protein
MKKLLALSIVLVLVSAAVFAQDAAGISIGGWGRTVLLPIQAVIPDADGLETKTFTGIGVDWGGAPDLEVTLSGSTENVGFNFQIFHSGGSFSNGNQANIWVKPWNFLEIKVGRYEVDVLRGKIDDVGPDGFENLSVGSGSADDIFTRFKSNTGALISLTPIEGLYIGAELDTFGSSGNDLTKDGVWGDVIDLFKDSDSRWEASNVFKTIQLGAGYEIAGIGHARAQFKGGLGEDAATLSPPKAPDAKYWESYADEFPYLQLAFAFTAVEGLTVDLGGKIPFAYEDDADVTHSDAIGVSVGASFALDAFSVGARIDTGFGGGIKQGSVEGVFGTKFNFEIVPAYDFGFAKVGLQVGLTTRGEAKYNDVGQDNATSQFGFGAFISKAYANGGITAGLTYKLGEKSRENDKDVTGPAVFSIPIILTYSF